MLVPKRGDAHIKRGTIREDGKLFWSYKKNKELWISKDQYEKRENTRRQYVIKCRQRYYQRQNAKHLVERNFIGKYNFSKNLYFIKVSTSGKEVWGTKEQLDQFRKMHTKCRLRMYYRLKNQYPPTGLKVGDKNPNNPKEYVVFFLGNKPYFGNKSRLKRVKEGRAITYRKRNEKYKILRKQKLKSIEKRIKRGTINSETGLVFLYYAQNGKERWVAREFYQKFLEKEKIRKTRQKVKVYIKSCEDSKNISS